jgi:hypothetical protein
MMFLSGAYRQLYVRINRTSPSEQGAIVYQHNKMQVRRNMQAEASRLLLPVAAIMR